MAWAMPPSPQSLASGAGWHFQLSSSAASRLREKNGCEVVGSLLAAGIGDTVTPRASDPRASASESPLLASVRRKIEAFEESIAEGRGWPAQCERSSPGKVPQVQPMVDRAPQGSISPLYREGGVRRFSDEELQHRFVDIEERVASALCAFRRSFEASERRLERLEGRASAAAAAAAEEAPRSRLTGASLLSTQVLSSALEARVQKLEERCADRALAICEAAARAHGSAEALAGWAAAGVAPTLTAAARGTEAPWEGAVDPAEPSRGAALGRRVDDVEAEIRRALEDSRETHTRLAAQEEQFRMFRASFEARDSHLRSVTEHLGAGELGSRFEGLRQSIQELVRQRVEQDERLELLARKVDIQEQSQDERLELLAQKVDIQEQNQEDLKDALLTEGYNFDIPLLDDGSPLSSAWGTQVGIGSIPLSTYRSGGTSDATFS